MTFKFLPRKKSVNYFTYMDKYVCTVLPYTYVFWNIRYVQGVRILVRTQHKTRMYIYIALALSARTRSWSTKMA